MGQQSKRQKLLAGTPSTVFPHTVGSVLIKVHRGSEEPERSLRTFRCMGEPVAQLVTSFTAAVKEIASSVIEGSTSDKGVLCAFTLFMIRWNAHVKA
jgi:hypothetical protein